MGHMVLFFCGTKRNTRDPVVKGKSYKQVKMSLVGKSAAVLSRQPTTATQRLITTSLHGK